MAFTGRAIAFAEKIADVEVVASLEKQFAKGFKALHLYGGKVIFPSELVRLTLTPSA
jgi:hypothetical protein